MDEFVRHALTGLAAFVGIAAWDVVRTWAFSRWMVRRITRGSVGHETRCPECGARTKVSVALESDPDSD